MENRLDKLRNRVDELLLNSRDIGFTEYLKQMKIRIDNQERQFEFLEDELDKWVKMYEDNLRLSEKPEQPEMITAEPEPQPEAVMPAQPENIEPSQSEDVMPVQPENTLLSQTEAVVPTQPENVTSTEPESIMPAQPENVISPESENTTPVRSENVTLFHPEYTMPPQPENNIPPQPRVQYVAASGIPARPIQPVPQMQSDQAVKPVTSKRNAEFTIGGAVMGIVGGTFILVAIALLGTYFLHGFMKGALLYAACIAVMVLSETILYRIRSGLGMTFSAIGMGGLYISTLINYLALHNFNQWVALGLTLLITLVVILLSRKRDAAAYRLLGMVAVYVCILLVPEGSMSDGRFSQIEFVTIITMVFIVNIMCLAVPVKKAHTAIHITHMALNAFFTLIAYACWISDDLNRGAFDSAAGMWQYPLCIFAAILVHQLIFIRQVRWKEIQTPGDSLYNNLGICITYGVSSLVYLPMIEEVTNFVFLISEEGQALLFQEYDYLLLRIICSCIVAGLCMIPIIFMKKKQEKWFSWYLFNLLVFVIHNANVDNDWEMMASVLILLVLSKLLSFTRRPMLRISDAVVTTYVCLNVLVDSEQTYVIPLAIGLVISILCINYWNTYFETILALTIALYVSSNMISALKLPVFVGILFVSMLLFNNIERFKGKDNSIVIFNAFALGAQVVAYLMLINPVYRNSYITYSCMLIFGIATIVICFQKNYHLDFKYKQLILAVFMTYMGIIVRTNFSIVNSILLMIIALICVGMGFVIDKKSVRIYGLVLSLVICGKLVVYDFMGANILQKTIVFFVVGVLALIIATIYMVLERK